MMAVDKTSLIAQQTSEAVAAANLAFLVKALRDAYAHCELGEECDVQVNWLQGRSIATRTHENLRRFVTERMRKQLPILQREFVKKLEADVKAARENLREIQAKELR